jgi:Flp pilus assembly protein TadB
VSENLGHRPIPPDREPLYRFMRRVGLVLLPFWCVAGVLLGMRLLAFGVIGLLGALVSLYLIFGFRYINEWLRRRKSA